MKPTLIKEDEINQELTQKAKNNPKYKLFLEWAIKNGVKFANIDFPVAFGPSSIIGIAATEYIPPSTTFMAIPNKLLITPKKVMASPIGMIIKTNSDYFLKNNDSDYNILTIYLLYERLKDKDSFFYPMFNAMSDCYTLIKWDEEDLDELDDSDLKEEVKEFGNKLDAIWLNVKSILSQYPQFFPPAKQILLDLAKISSLTPDKIKCFGWTLPTTMLVPFADFLNHLDHSTKHDVINLRFEMNQENVDNSYMTKKRKTDLSLLNKGLKLDETIRKENLETSLLGYEYCLNNHDYINKKNSELIKAGNLNNSIMKNIISQVNMQILKTHENIHIWRLKFFDESNDSDNDSDDEKYESPKKVKLVGFKSINNDEVEGEEQKEEADSNQETDNELNKEDEDNAEWKWYNHNDDENFFIVSTDKASTYEKGEQIYCCYGRRTNRFLLLWYGFAIRHNRFDSLIFKLWMNCNTQSIMHPRNILVKPNITQKNEFRGKDNNNTIGKSTMEMNELTREFKVKSSSLCENVLTHLRGLLMLNYKGSDSNKILVTMPTSLNYEEFILNYAVSLFIEIKNQYKTTIYEDEMILKDKGLDIKKRFATLLRLGHKEIAEEQIKLIKILLHIIEKLKSGLDFKQAYMCKCPEFDKNDEDMYQTRKKLSHYLSLLYENYDKQSCNVVMKKLEKYPQ